MLTPQQTELYIKAAKEHGFTIPIDEESQRKYTDKILAEIAQITVGDGRTPT